MASVLLMSEAGGVGACAAISGAVIQVPTIRTSSTRSRQPNGGADRQILEEARLEHGEVDIEHHHHEQEQHQHRADIDDDQDHRQEFGAELHEQPGGVEEGEDQE